MKQLGVINCMLYAVIFFKYHMHGCLLNKIILI